MAVHGFVATSYEAVEAAFRRNFDERGEVGAAFAAFRDDELVVDLWGGVADPASGKRWASNTVQLIFSGTKGLAAACVLLLVERGQVDLDRPLASYWPEFGALGKGALTVGEVLSHQARLPVIEAAVTTAELLDHATMADLLGRQAPSLDPRAEFAYHALTWGWLVDELARRIDGRSIGALFADEFAAPLGLEVWIGLPDTLRHRVSTMVSAPGVLGVHADNPLLVEGAESIWNSDEYRRAGLAAVGAFATARGMARFYACLARGGELDGVRVLGEATVKLGRQEIRERDGVCGWVRAARRTTWDRSRTPSVTPAPVGRGTAPGRIGGSASPT
jgi:CubicO group peptidase (beta-lactamase class C family)